MLDDERIPARRHAAETLFGILTLFTYEQLQQRTISGSWAVPGGHGLRT